MIPSRAWTLELIRQRGMPRHIYRHSVMVQRVALALAAAAAAAGMPLEAALIDRAALLHDICKIEGIKGGGDHAALGEQLLVESGFERIGAIIGQHVRLREYVFNEALVVFYADKRVKHDRVVSLDRRFVDLMQRYGTDDQRQERILQHYDMARRCEDLVVDACRIAPEVLDRLNLIAGDDAFDCGDGLL